MSIPKLHPRPLRRGTTVVAHDHGLSELVRPDSPALEVMTDLRRSRAVTTVGGATLESAHQRMIHTGVRMLLVLDREGSVTGLLTATDLLGEKPMAVATREQVSHDQLRVEHVMTRAEEVQVVSLDEVVQARVSDVVALLRETGRQHALVTEGDAAGEAIRGVFSLSQIARQLGKPLELPGVAHSVAELEHVINH